VKSRYTIATAMHPSMRTTRLTVLVLLAPFAGAACQPTPTRPGGLRYALAGPLVPARMTMTTAWDYPRHPLTDQSLDESKLSKEIKLGYRIFTNTPGEAPKFTPGKGSCNNCHLNGGQRERSLPLVGVAGMFPEYSRRAGRLISLGDRVVDCFLRSMNATGRLPEGAASRDAAVLPTPLSREVLAVSAYLAWVSRGSEMGQNPSWRGQNTLAQEALIPVAALDRGRGEQLYAEKCVSCHGLDGQGVAVGDKKAGPLWGDDSWNDGAGAARVYTLAGIIRYSMPYLDPGSLTDEESQLIAAYINSKPRPSYPFKDLDYQVDPLPIDAVYYPRRK
jgi:thiosulfate dehydrogenase